MLADYMCWYETVFCIQHIVLEGDKLSSNTHIDVAGPDLTELVEGALESDQNTVPKALHPAKAQSTFCDHFDRRRGSL